MTAPHGTKALVCGGRDYADKDKVFSVLDAEHGDRPIAVLIEGGAKGADALARQWAQKNNIPVESFPADWKKHGRAAGPKRNQRMIDEKPDIVFAFPGGRGTADMVRRARSAGVPVITV